MGNKLFLIIILFGLSSLACAQQNNKEKYKDYRACSECFDKWSNSYANSNGTQPINLFKGAGIEAKSQTSKVIRVIGGIFITAITLSIYAKANRTANETIQ
jgi:hypothetical protein